MILIRSLIFQISFYLVTALMAVPAVLFFIFSPKSAGRWISRLWASIGVGLLRFIVGIRLVVRGTENLPPGGILVASKHQSMFETFALLKVLEHPTFVMKQELLRIPLWGWYAKRLGTIAVERDQGTSALRHLAADVAKAIGDNRQVVIFPEGTRRPPGAPPSYKGGVAHLYRKTGVPVVPLALNSGLFWPRRPIRLYPGTIIFAFQAPIAPGLKSRDFMVRLESEIESASDQLLLETARVNPSPAPLPEALERLHERQQA